MFREDFEFGDGAARRTSARTRRRSGGAEAELAETAPSHVPRCSSRISATGQARRSRPASWTPEAEKELKKIPFFVRGKARRNTETLRARARPRLHHPGDSV